MSDGRHRRRHLNEGEIFEPPLHPVELPQQQVPSREDELGVGRVAVVTVIAQRLGGFAQPLDGLLQVPAGDRDLRFRRYRPGPGEWIVDEAFRRATQQGSRLVEIAELGERDSAKGERFGLVEERDPLEGLERTSAREELRPLRQPRLGGSPYPASVVTPARHLRLLPSTA